MDTVDAGSLALPSQQDEQPTIAETPPFVGKLAQLTRSSASEGRRDL
jgi:hypothetical protein